MCARQPNESIRKWAKRGLNQGLQETRHVPGRLSAEGPGVGGRASQAEAAAHAQAWRPGKPGQGLALGRIQTIEKCGRVGVIETMLNPLCPINCARAGGDAWPPLRNTVHIFGGLDFLNSSIKPHRHFPLPVTGIITEKDVL